MHAPNPPKQIVDKVPDGRQSRTDEARQFIALFPTAEKTSPLVTTVIKIDGRATPGRPLLYGDRVRERLTIRPGAHEEVHQRPIEATAWTGPPSLWAEMDADPWAANPCAGMVQLLVD